MRLQSWTFNAHVFILLLSLINGLIHWQLYKIDLLHLLILSLRWLYFYNFSQSIYVFYQKESISITRFYFESLRFMWFICTWKISFRKFLYLYWHLKFIQMRYNFYECQRIKEFHRCHLPLWSDISANSYWYHF